LAAYSAIKIIAPSFYALGDSRTPMYVALVSIIINAGLDYLFGVVMKMHTAGLALSTSFVALTNFLLLMIFMRRKIARIEATSLLRSLIRICIASAAMSAAAWYTHVQFVGHRYLDLAISIGVAVLAFGAVCRLLRVEEFDELLAALRLGTNRTKP
jgi:putative peptidoglycan lipid II flippase